MTKNKITCQVDDVHKPISADKTAGRGGSENLLAYFQIKFYNQLYVFVCVFVCVCPQQ